MPAAGRATPRINLFIRNLCEKGGGEGVCYRFLDFLVRNDVQVTVYCGRNRLPRGHEFAPLIRELGLVGLSKLTKYWSMNRNAQPHLHGDAVNFSFDRIENVDVFRSGGGFHRAFMEKSLFGYPPLRRLRKRIVRTLSPSNAYLCTLEERVFLNPKLRSIVVSSVMARDEIALAYPSVEHKIAVVPNGIDKELFAFAKTVAHRRELRKRYGLDGRRVIGFASNNFERKGLHHAVDALRFLPEDHVLLVAGKGEIEPYRLPGLKDRIRFLGSIDRMDEAFYPALDVFCFPSLYDPFGFVTAEALCMGIPVVATRQSGSHETIREGANGFVLDSFSPREIAGKITAALDLPVMAYGSSVLGIQDMYQGYLEAAFGAPKQVAECPPPPVRVPGEPVQVRT